MKIAYNPKTVAALTTAPDNDDITFDLSGMAIYAKGVKVGGTYLTFKKHTASSNTGGYDGLVPVPSYNSNSTTRFLREDGTWVAPSHYTTHLYIGAKDVASNAATTNGNTYIKVTDNSTIRNQYIIKGSGNTSVSSDASGNITINSPTTISWDSVSGKPDTFTPSSHNHSTSAINALTGYTKATSAAALSTSDTLNAALGKLEYKAHYAYDWITGVTKTDSDEYINKWSEIVGFLDSVKEGTDILDEFVTRKTAQVITGKKNFNTDTNASPLVISRTGGTIEAVSIGVNDSQAIFEYVNDEKSNSFVFKLINNDTESSDGSGANTNTVTFTGNSSGSTVAATTFQGRLAYTYLTGSGTTKDQVIVSSGTANGWALKTLGSRAFDSTSYLPLSGGTLTNSSVPLTINRTGATYSSISYQMDGTQIGVMGFDVNTGEGIISPNRTSNSSYFTLLHTGNSSVSGDGGSTWGSSITVKINGTSKTLTIPANPNTDTKVTQTNTTGSADYRVLFSVTADDTTRTEGARKSTNLKFNPSTGTLTATTFTGALSGNATTATTASKVANTLTLTAGTFAATSYNGSAAVTVKIPTKVSHLTNDSGFVTGGPYLPLSGGTMTGSIYMGTNNYIYGVNESSGAMLHFDGTRTILGSVGTTSTSNTHIRSKDATVTIGTSNTASYIVLHSGNYTSYVNTTNFPGLNKTGTITGVTAGTGLSGGGTSGTVTLTNAGVRSTTINGNYLRVNTNGTNADLTIPYATLASKVTCSAATSNTDRPIVGTNTSNQLYYTTKATINWSTGNITAPTFISNLTTSTHINGNKGTAIINSTAAAGYNMLAKMNSTNGVFTIGAYNAAFNLYYTANTTINAGTNSTTKNVTLLNESGNSSFPGNVTAGGFVKSGSSDSYVLLGGGGHKALSDFAMASAYVKKAGDTMTGSLTFSNTATIIRPTNTSSNYVSDVIWYKGTSASTSGTYDAQIGWHNTGDTNGAITILPYTTTTQPWNGSVGLYVSKTLLKYNGNSILTTANYSSTLDGRYYTETEADSRFVNVTGDTMTGKLTLMSSAYTDDGVSSALHLSNSNITGVNAIYFADASESALEGINFFRSSTTVDTIWGASGVLYYTPNRTFGNNGTNYVILHSNNYSTYLDSRYYTESEINSKLSGYLPLSGGTLTGKLTISYSVSADMTTASSNPQIVFAEDGTQPVQLMYTDYDSYRSPAGLKLLGSQGGEWFEVAGNVYGAGFVKTNSSDSYVLLGGGGHKTISSLSVNYANSAGNANTVDSYHIAVVESSAGTDSSTIYFVI